MGQKTHPLGFRIGITQNHRSAWYAKMTEYPKYLQEDYSIRKYINNKFNTASIADIYINKKMIN